ncbi:hypothetical protein KZ309_26425, partial [Escherichia coli]|uniref:hypothetical protein n=1 Tax=Escherichia coli TaxID=562 RepID=UPI001ED9E2F0
MNYRHLILTSLAGMALNLTPALDQETKKPEPKQETGTKPVAAAPAEAAPEAPAPKESAEAPN